MKQFGFRGGVWGHLTRIEAFKEELVWATDKRFQDIVCIAMWSLANYFGIYYSGVG